MDGNTSVAVSTRWANQGRRVPLLRNKDILLHFDSQCVIYTCTCVYKRNQKYFISIYKGTTPSWILFVRYSLFFCLVNYFVKVVAVEPHSKLKDIRIYCFFKIEIQFKIARQVFLKCCHSQSVVFVMFG